MDVELLTWPELVARAGSTARARRHLRDGHWWRLMHGLYAPMGAEDGAHLRAAAVRVSLPAHVTLSHRSALWVLGLDVLGSGLDVTVPRGLRLQARQGLRPHTAELADEDVCELEGLRLVSAARAVVDVARAESLVEAVAVGDAALRSGAATAGQVSDVVARSFGLRGVLRAREVVRHLDGRSESPMESRMRMRFVLGGVPGVVSQQDLYDDDGHVCRADWLVRGVVVEYDGRLARLDPGVFVRERRRQNRIAAAGCELRRFTAADYYHRSAASVCAELVHAVEQAARRGGSGLRPGPDTLRPPRLRPLPTLAQTALRAA